MNIEDFVKEALCQIIGGVVKAQHPTGEGSHNCVKDQASLINPKICRWPVSSNDLYLRTEAKQLVQMVDFDLAISADSSTQSGGGLSLKVLDVGIGGDLKNLNKESMVSRVKFQIPITLPSP